MTYISMPTVKDGKGELTPEGTLAEIERKARAIVVESTQIITKGEEARQKGAGTPNAHAELYADIATEALAGSAGKLIKDGVSFLSERAEDKIDLAGISQSNPLIPASAKSFETLQDEASGPGLFERIGLASSSLLGNSTPKSGGAGEGINLSSMDVPGGSLSGVQHYCAMQYTLRMASEKHLNQVQRVRLEQGPIRAQMARTPHLGMDAYRPKPPSLEEMEEESTNWGAGQVTG